MKPSIEQEPWWLTPDQRQLLLAIFGEGAVASQARKAWGKDRSIETTEPTSMPLVPLLFRRSPCRTTEGAEVTPFRGVYRRTWYHNHLVLRDLAVILARFREARIKALLPAELSLLVASYNDIGLRPVDGPGVIVDPDQAEAAVEVLLKSGWKHNLAGGEALSRRDQAWIRLSDGNAKYVELMWAFATESSSRAKSKGIWDRAVPVSIGGEETLALSSTDQLLASPQVGCWQPVPAGRWLADALTILLSGGPQLDWGRVIAFSQPSRMSLWAYSRLSYLRNQWSIAIPADVLAAINLAPKSIIDRVEYTVRRSRIPMSEGSMVHRALTTILSPRSRVSQFPRSVLTP